MSTPVSPSASPTFGLLNGMDPMSALVDMGGQILGLPPEVRNVAKIVVGVMYPNPIAVWNGISGLAQNAAEAAATEYKPTGYQSTLGYAPTGRADTCDGSSGVVSQSNGAASKPNRTSRGAGKPTAGATPSAAPQAKPSPSSLKIAVAPDVSAGTSAGGTTAADGKNRVLTQEDRAYYDALNVLAGHWERAETAGGWVRDNWLTMNDLKAIANDPNAPQDLLRAAQFFLEHEDRFFALTQAHRGTFDSAGGLRLASVRAELVEGHRRGALTADGGGTPGAGGIGGTSGTGSGGAAGGATGSGSGGGSGGGVGGVGGGSGAGGASGPDPLDLILNDPRLSAEEKAERILLQILSDLDGDVLSLLGEIRDVRREQAGAADDKEKGAELASNMEMLQYRLQKVMERRTQMLTLLTNMSKLNHEAHMAFIRNMPK